MVDDLWRAEERVKREDTQGVFYRQRTAKLRTCRCILPSTASCRCARPMATRAAAAPPVPARREVRVCDQCVYESTRAVGREDPALVYLCQRGGRCLRARKTAGKFGTV